MLNVTMPQLDAVVCTAWGCTPLPAIYGRHARAATREDSTSLIGKCSDASVTPRPDDYKYRIWVYLAVMQGLKLHPVEAMRSR